MGTEGRGERSARQRGSYCCLPTIFVEAAASFVLREGWERRRLSLLGQSV